MRIGWFRGLLLFVMVAVGATLAAPAPTSEFIYQPGSTSFPSSHASTLVQLKNGDIMAAWFGGTHESANDVAIWGAHLIFSKDGSSHWTKPVLLVREPDIPCWNPVLFHTKDGRLWLYYKFGPHPVSWVAGRMYSDDEGQTWSPVEHLPAGLIGPVRAKPLVLKDGTIVSGSSIEAYHSWAAWVERSTNNGKTWAKIGPIVPPLSLDVSQPVSGNQKSGAFGIIQPSVISMGGRHLRLYARSTRQIGRICIADSYDNGVTWTQAHPIDVPNPNSGMDAIRLKDGRIVLVYNNTTSGRSPLNLAVSKDGKHFRMFYTLEDKPGEYSYPSLIQGHNGDLYMTYTWQRKTIRFVHFPLADVPK
ncbi:MAG: sialidase family protein [Acidobacteriaceae bacterium]